MKRVFTLLAFLFISLSFINAQGIYQFWGTTANGGSNNTGVLFSTDTTTLQSSMQSQVQIYTTKKLILTGTMVVIPLEV